MNQSDLSLSFCEAMPLAAGDATDIIQISQGQSLDPVFIPGRHYITAEIAFSDGTAAGALTVEIHHGDLADGSDMAMRGQGTLSTDEINSGSRVLFINAAGKSKRFQKAVIAAAPTGLTAPTITIGYGRGDVDTAGL